MCKIWFPKGGGDEAYQRGGTYQKILLLKGGVIDLSERMQLDQPLQ